MPGSHPSVEVAGNVLAGRYRLVRPVAQGGLASVWEAEHVTLHRKLAVKFLLETGAADTEASQRFLREAQVAASVKHRNVLDIIDFGFTDDAAATLNTSTPLGVPYMVMELLEGRTLEDLIQHELQLSVERAVDIASGVLRGLAAVHDAGLLHRDIKPDNVFLVADEEGDFPKLVDFGLSRPVGPSNLTLQGAVLGTPLYMAPEQVLGGSELDARVDLYAMGVLLYEMLAGQVPFCGETPVETFRMIQHATAQPLSVLAPNVPDALARVVEKAMEKRPEARFADARAMRVALQAAVPGSAAPDRSSGPEPRVSPDPPPPAPASEEPSVRMEIVRDDDESSPSPRSSPSGISHSGVDAAASRAPSERPPAAAPGPLGWAAVAVALVLLVGGAWLALGRDGETDARVIPAGPFVPIGADAALVDAGTAPARRTSPRGTRSRAPGER